MEEIITHTQFENFPSFKCYNRTVRGKVSVQPATVIKITNDDDDEKKSRQQEIKCCLCFLICIA